MSQLLAKRLQRAGKLSLKTGQKTGGTSQLGFSTVLATNGLEGLREVNSAPERFDVVFSDVVMPGMTGIERGKEIRRLHGGLPIVLASGYSHVLAAGGTDGFELIHKPYSIDQVSRVLRRAAAHRERTGFYPGNART